MANLRVSKKPHAVCVPNPAQGHLNPMMKLAKLLHYKGFYITFVNTEYNHKRLLSSRGSDSLNGLPDFVFETIPDGLPPTDNINDPQDARALCVSLTKNCLDPFLKLLAKLNHSSSIDNGNICPPVTCIVSDNCMSFTQDAAAELMIPDVVFWTAGACSFMGCFYLKHLIETGITPLKDEIQLTNGYLDETKITCIPGMKDIRLRDLPGFVRATDPDDIFLNFVTSEAQNCKRATAIVINTFDAFEGEIVNEMKSILPPVYTIGPFQLLLHQIPQENHEIHGFGSNLWSEEPKCFEWLDSKQPNSVVYVNFGSITVMNSQQLTEFAWGLANSKYNFLWIIRPGLVLGHSSVLPPEFMNEVKDRCFIASWCAQEEILRHPSVGGFLTHSGWNSTLDTVIAGVPVICWPFFADQLTNCRYSCAHWKFGLEISNNVKRDEVEILVRELMNGEKGKDMKKRVMEWKNRAEEAAKPGGSSFVNLDKLVNEVLLQTKKI